MNDTLDLEQRLRELAATVPAPTTPVEQDLERGRRRVRRTRWLATGGAAAGVAAIALGVGLAGSVSDPSGSEPAPATQATEATETPTPQPSTARDDRTGAELLQAYRDVLAEHLDPDGTHLQKKPDNLQSGAGLGTKLGWTMPGQDGLGLVEVFVGRGRQLFIGITCEEPTVECSDTSVDGISAQVMRWEGSTTVVVEQTGGTVAITLNPLFGNNSLVPVEGMDIPVDDVVRAAADERLTPATPEQVRNAGTSMGFPDYDEPAPGGEGASEAPAQG